ncbi:hypothetical protein GGER_34360 [Serratia rubidaea]
MAQSKTGSNHTVADALDQLEARYQSAVEALRTAIGDFIDNGTLPDAQARAAGLFVYPELRVSWHGAAPSDKKTRAYGRFTHPGCYTTSVTRPALFRHYLEDQLTLLVEEYGATIDVAPRSAKSPIRT